MKCHCLSTHNEEKLWGAHRKLSELGEIGNRKLHHSRKHKKQDLIPYNSGVRSQSPI